MRDLLPVIEALDRAVSHASAVLGEEELEPAAEVAQRVRRRRGFLGETVVVALAGGTGSGKSSLLNALAEEKVAGTGARRPVTERPLAWVPANPEPGLVRLLDELGVEDRVGQDRFEHLAILDLPDFDSVEAGHRAIVEDLLPRVDAVLWVLDPEKYNDRVIHRRYLAPLAGYGGQFLFVLNQIDRLDEEELDRVERDLVASLRSDGIQEPRVFPLAADPPDGPPRGLEALRRHLADRIDAKQVASAKLAEDLRRAGHHLAEEAGVTAGAAMGFAARWREERDEVVDSLAEMAAGGEVRRLQEEAGRRRAIAEAGGLLGRLKAKAPRTAVGRALGGAALEDAPRRATRSWASRPGLEGAVARLTEFVTRLSFEAGGAFGRRVREEFGPERIETELRRAMEAALEEAGPPPPPAPARWWGAVGAIQLLLLGVLVAGGVWAWARPETLGPGEWPWPLVAVGGAVVGMAVLSRLVAWSGRRAGRAVAEEFRGRVAGRLAAQLDERLGTPLRRTLRDRALLAAALAELGVRLAEAEPPPR